MIGDLHRFERGQVERVEILRPPPRVSFPRAKVADEGGVNDHFPVGRKSARARHGHGQRYGQPAVDRGGEEPGVGKIPTVTHRPKEHGRAVHRPSVHLIVIAPAVRQGTAGRIPGELARFTAAVRYDVNLFVTVDLAGESDPSAVGRELGEQLDTGMTGETDSL